MFHMTSFEMQADTFERISEFAVIVYQNVQEMIKLVSTVGAAASKQSKTPAGGNNASTTEVSEKNTPVV